MHPVAFFAFFLVVSAVAVLVAGTVSVGVCFYFSFVAVVLMAIGGAESKILIRIHIFRHKMLQISDDVHSKHQAICISQKM